MRAAITTVTAILLMAGAPAQAGVEAGKIVDAGFDVVVLRPVGVVSTVVGAVLFVPAVLLTLPNGRAGIDQARERFITVPVESTFTRELGDW